MATKKSTSKKTNEIDPRFIDAETELSAMLEYYSKEYSEVYFVRDLKVGCIIAVECYPHRSDRPGIPRNGRKADVLNYKDRLLSSRERFDKTPDGKSMIGYESISGNDTRLGKSEGGVVATKAATPEQYMMVSGSSPFEIAMQKNAVASNQLKDKNGVDYELTRDENGMTIERFETFAVERMK